MLISFIILAEKILILGDSDRVGSATLGVACLKWYRKMTKKKNRIMYVSLKVFPHFSKNNVAHFLLHNFDHQTYLIRVGGRESAKLQKTFILQKLCMEGTIKETFVEFCFKNDYLMFNKSVSSHMFSF